MLNVITPKPDFPLTVTWMAGIKIKHHLEEDSLGIRIGVIGGGCSGFSYELKLAKEKRPDDQVWERDGVTYYIDEMSLPYLKGVTIDWKNEGLMAGFTFDNPNASKTCGCGTSFAP